MIIHTQSEQIDRNDQQGEKPVMVKDPVCGMSIRPEKAAGHSEFEGRTWHFCSIGCKTKFDASPTKFTGTAKPPRTNMGQSDAGSYTCPMHPEIVRDQPGSCPICGMALEPRTLSLTEEENPELKDMSLRFWVSVGLTVPLVVIAMAHLVPSQLFKSLLMNNQRWIELLLATPVVLWGGWPFFVRGWQSVWNRSPNMFTLIALGTGVAYGYSVAAALFPAFFPEAFKDEHGQVGLYFEAAAVIVALVLLGQVMELKSRSERN